MSAPPASFLQVLRALDGSVDVDPGLQVSDALRWAQADGQRALGVVTAAFRV